MTNRRNFLVKFTMAAGAATFLQPLQTFAGFGTQSATSLQLDRLTILHTGNLKGQWPALGVDERLSGLGGLQNVMKKIKEIKKESSSVLLIDAGNMIGSRSRTREDGLRFYKRFRDAGYDAVIPGQTDLGKGKDYFTQLAEESALPFIPYESSFFAGGAMLPFSIVKKGKFKIGIINAGTAALKNIAGTSDLQTSAAVNNTAYRLKKMENCILIVCLVQASQSECAALAGFSGQIDVIINAAEKESMQNIHIVRNKADAEVVVSYAGAKGTMMSRIDITFNENFDKINFASKAIFIGAKQDDYAAIMKQHKLSYT